MWINTTTEIIESDIEEERIITLPEFIAPGQLDAAMENIGPHLVQRYIMGGPRPRQEALFSKPGTAGTYSYANDLGAGVEATGWLAELWENLPAYDICLANFYADGSQSISRHADDEADIFGHVFSVSLGAPRTFNVWRTDGLKKIELTDGCGCWFRGDVLEHAIPKTAKPVGPRLSLTFRQTR
jgi:hypothetical protein